MAEQELIKKGATMDQIRKELDGQRQEAYRLDKGGWWKGGTPRLEPRNHDFHHWVWDRPVHERRLSTLYFHFWDKWGR